MIHKKNENIPITNLGFPSFLQGEAYIKGPQYYIDSNNEETLTPSSLETTPFFSSSFKKQTNYILATIFTKYFVKINKYVVTPTNIIYMITSTLVCSPWHIQQNLSHEISTLTLLSFLAFAYPNHVASQNINAHLRF